MLNTLTRTDQQLNEHYAELKELTNLEGHFLKAIAARQQDFGGAA